jgi:DNA-binding NtrC family response regulator
MPAFARREERTIMARKKRIFCISYDESLLITRKMILEQAGFEIIPAIGFAEAEERCENELPFELIIMGHSMLRKDKTALIGILRRRCNAPVLSIRRHNDPPLPEAEFSIDSYDGPEALIEIVNRAVGSKAPPQSTSDRLGAGISRPALATEPLRKVL